MTCRKTSEKIEMLEVATPKMQIEANFVQTIAKFSSKKLQI
jgi:hypothetical protein